MENCIICKQNYKVGAIAPENWGICIDCIRQGYMVCESDKKIFNRTERIKKDFTIHNPQTFVIGNHDLLEGVGKSFTYMQYEEKVCDDRCYNMLYLDKCIDELKMHQNMILMEKMIPLLKNIVINEEKREIFKRSLEDRISQLERYKQDYK